MDNSSSCRLGRAGRITGVSLLLLMPARCDVMPPLELSINGYAPRKPSLSVPECDCADECTSDEVPWIGSNRSKCLHLAEVCMPPAPDTRHLASSRRKSPETNHTRTIDRSTALGRASMATKQEPDMQSKLMCTLGKSRVLIQAIPRA